MSAMPSKLILAKGIYFLGMILAVVVGTTAGKGNLAHVVI